MTYAPYGDILSQTTLLNRQSPHLRPNPARVVIRPFKPSTDPRDLHPTDMRRANLIYDRVLGLDPESARLELAEVLEGFKGRHRRLQAAFEARSDVMGAHAAHPPLTGLQ